MNRAKSVQLAFYGMLTFTCFLHCTSRMNSQIQGQDSLLQSKRFVEYQYEVNNSNKDSIGYLTFKEGDTYSISSILIHNSYAYLTDEIHGNIKRIDLNTGELFSSKRIDMDSSWVERITFFNDSYYVLTTSGRFYILDSLLNLQESFYIPKYFGEKSILSQSSDSLAFFLNPSDCMESEDLHVKIRRCILKADNTFSFDTISLGKGNNIVRDLLNNYSRGRKAKLEEIDGKYFLNTSTIQYELNAKIEKVRNIACVNFDFSSDFVVWFNISEERLRVFVQEY